MNDGSRSIRIVLERTQCKVDRIYLKSFRSASVDVMSLEIGCRSNLCIYDVEDGPFVEQVEVHYDI